MPEMEQEFRRLCRGLESLQGAVCCMQSNESHTVKALQSALQNYGDTLQTKMYPVQADEVHEGIAFDELKRRILQVREGFLTSMGICNEQPHVQSMLWSLRCTQARYSMQIKELQVLKREVFQGEGLAPCVQCQRLQLSMKASMLGLCKLEVEAEVFQTVRGADKEYMHTHRKLKDMPQIPLLQNFVWSACDKMKILKQMQERVQSIELNRKLLQRELKRPVNLGSIDIDEDADEAGISSDPDEQPLQSQQDAKVKRARSSAKR
jgi:hypothetical protein